MYDETFVNCCDVHICGCYIQHLWTSARRGGWALVQVPREETRLSPSTNPRSTLSSDDRDDSHDGRKLETVVVTLSWPFVESDAHDHSLFNIQCASLLVKCNFLKLKCYFKVKVWTDIFVPSLIHLPESNSVVDLRSSLNFLHFRAFSWKFWAINRLAHPGKSRICRWTLSSLKLL